MIIADGSKRFCRSFHGIAAPCAVHMKINKAGCEIISVKIKNLTCVCLDSLADCGDFSFFNNELKAVTNAIRKNQMRIGKNHFASTYKLGIQQSRIPTQKRIAKKHPA